ncbi:MAG: hypothetical protein IPI14_12735 [Polaromonas sp.]|nr:hypothetical protein [Polaromonas sp.]
MFPSRQSQPSDQEPISKPPRGGAQNSRYQQILPNPPNRITQITSPTMTAIAKRIQAKPVEPASGANASKDLRRAQGECPGGRAPAFFDVGQSHPTSQSLYLDLSAVDSLDQGPLVPGLKGKEDDQA